MEMQKKAAESREKMYRLLAGIYIQEIDKKMLDALKNMEFPKQDHPKESYEMDLSEGYALVEKYLDGVTFENVDEMLEYLAADYAKIFLAAGQADGKAAFPYESVYTSEGKECGGVDLHLNALYLSKGLEINPDMFRIEADHIGLEFSYMAKLCSLQAEYCGNGDSNKAEETVKEEIEFYKDHFGKWITAFTTDIYKLADEDFYKGFAKITRGFLTLEKEILKSLR